MWVYGGGGEIGQGGKGIYHSRVYLSLRLSLIGTVLHSTPLHMHIHCLIKKLMYTFYFSFISLKRLHVFLFVILLW